MMPVAGIDFKVPLSHTKKGPTQSILALIMSLFKWAIFSLVNLTGPSQKVVEVGEDVEATMKKINEKIKACYPHLTLGSPYLDRRISIQFDVYMLACAKYFCLQEDGVKKATVTETYYLAVANEVTTAAKALTQKLDQHFPKRPLFTAISVK